VDGKLTAPSVGRSVPSRQDNYLYGLEIVEVRPNQTGLVWIAVLFLVSLYFLLSYFQAPIKIDGNLSRQAVSAARTPATRGE
jgi:hypothetical protein